MDEHEVMYIPIEEKIHVSNDMKIDEMLHISLKPNIIMQMKHDFILLKGDLILQGNYRLLEDEEPFDRKEPQMEQVQLLGDNKAMFLHGFPIEIAIEKSKVKNVDDVSMQMEMFDYHLVDPVTIHVTANVMIQGIDQSEDDYRTKEAGKEAVDSLTSLYEKEEDKLGKEEEEASFKESIEVDQTERDNRKSAADQAFIEKRDPENPPILPREELEEEEEIALHANDETEAVKEDSERETKSSLFDLLFLNGDQTEQRTNIKMYIAQEEDYLEKIADRYGVSVYQLMNDNELTEDILEVGQILKIRQEK